MTVVSLRRNLRRDVYGTRVAFITQLDYDDDDDKRQDVATQSRHDDECQDRRRLDMTAATYVRDSDAPTDLKTTATSTSTSSSGCGTESCQQRA